METSQGKWYEPYLEKAIKFSIVSNGEFSDMNAPITRGQMAKILVKTLENQGESITDTSKFTSQIGDYASIDKYLQPYFLKAYAFGLMGGYPDGTFKPERLATRADSSVMLNRVFDKTVRSIPVVKNPYLSDRGIPLHLNGEEATTLDGKKIDKYAENEYVEKYLKIREMISLEYPEQKMNLYLSDYFLVIGLLDKSEKEVSYISLNFGEDIKYSFSSYAYHESHKDILNKAIKIAMPLRSDYVISVLNDNGSSRIIEGNYYESAHYNTSRNYHSVFVYYNFKY